MTEMLVRPEDPAAADVRALVERHLAFAHQQSPPEAVHAFDVRALGATEVSLYGIRSGGVLLGVGALQQLEPGHGELKSMHTAAAARERGVGRMMLDHLLAVARERGLARVSLETGTGEAFAPARRLYTSAGFVVCDPFAGYVPSPYGVCMTLVL